MVGLGVAPAAALPHSSGVTGFHVRVFRFVDHSRTIRLPDGRRVPWTLVTAVRYPATGGPYPLIVFAHGYALTPAPYAGLLRTWTRAGYVVAAPVFPLENANAPGGPDESDLINQPQDMSFVIGKLLNLNGRATGVLGGKIDPSLVAVAGHSDRAETALAVAYDHRFRNRRIRAAIVLSGSALPGMGGFPPKGCRCSRCRAPPTRPTLRRRPRPTSGSRGVRSSCSGCSEQHTSLRTRISNHSSVSSSGPPSCSSTTT